MTVAELFVSLGIKVENADQLTALETALKNITNQAKAAVAAIKALNAATVTGPTVQPVNPSAPGPAPAPTAPNPLAVPQPVPGGGQPAPPVPVPPLPTPTRVIAWASAVKKLSVEINKLAAVTAIAATGVIVLINKAIDATMRMANFGTATGLSTDRLQEFQHAAQVGGASASDMLALLDSLQLKQAQIALGEGDLSPFAFFGIDPNQDTNAVIDQLRVKLKTFSKEQLAVAREMAGRLGVGRDLFAAMLREARKLDEAFVMSPEAIEATQELNSAWKDLTFRLAAIRNQIVSAIAPAFAQMIKIMGVLLTPIAKFINYLNSGTRLANILRGHLAGLAIVLGVVAAAIISGSAALTAFTVVVGIFTVATSAAGVAIWTALAPILPIIALVVAAFVALVAQVTVIYLAFEDLWTAFHGGDSMIGRLLEKFGLISEAGSGIKAISEFWDGVTDSISLAADALGLFVGIVPDWVKSWFGSGDVAVNPMTAITQAAAMPPSNQPGGGGGVNNQTNDVTINVDGSKDPRATAAAVDQGLKRSLADAAYQMPVASY